MASDVPLQTQCPTSTRLLPQIPLTIHQMEAFVEPNNVSPTPLDYLSHIPGRPIHNSAVAASTFETKSLTAHASQTTGAHISVDKPVGNSGKRKGAPKVQWDASNDRKYARLYSLSDAHIDDLPIIMRDDKLKFQSVWRHKIVVWMLIFIFRKRIGQEKSSENLGPRPNELRPNSKDPKEMFERMKQFYISKRYLEERSRGNVLKQPNCPHPLGEAALGDLEALENQLEEEFSSGTFGSSGTSSYQFVEALENFAQNITDEPVQRSTELGIERRIRTSYEILQSLRRRINERKAKEGQKLREYSYEELVKYLFIKRLSVGSLPSNRSTTSSLLSKQSSDGSEISTSTSIRHSSTTLLSTIDDVASLSSDFTPFQMRWAMLQITLSALRQQDHFIIFSKPGVPNRLRQKLTFQDQQYSSLQTWLWVRLMTSIATGFRLNVISGSEKSSISNDIQHRTTWTQIMQIL